MNRAQNRQFQLCNIIMSLQADGPLELHVGDRHWLAAILTSAARGEDIRRAVGFVVQQGNTRTERPFWIAAHYRALRAGKIPPTTALKEVAVEWRVVGDTVREYSKHHRIVIDETIRLYGASKLLCLARWRVKIAEKKVVS
jgi:hypothetical protein